MKKKILLCMVVFLFVPFIASCADNEVADDHLDEVIVGEDENENYEIAINDHSGYVFIDDRFSMWGIDRWAHVGDDNNSSVAVNANQEKAQIIIEGSLNNYSRIQRGYSDEEASEYVGKEVKLTVEVEIIDLKSGAFVISIYDSIADGDTLDYQHTFSENIYSDGTYSIEVTRSMRENDFNSLGFIPGWFLEKSNSGAQAIISNVQIEVVE